MAQILRPSRRGFTTRLNIDCRQESGSAFTFYAVWPAHQFEHVGQTSRYQDQHFCPRCGSRLFSNDDREVKSSSGSCQKSRPLSCQAMSSGSNAGSHGCDQSRGAEQYEEDRLRPQPHERMVFHPCGTSTRIPTLKLRRGGYSRRNVTLLRLQWRTPTSRMRSRPLASAHDFMW